MEQTGSETEVVSPGPHCPSEKMDAGWLRRAPEAVRLPSLLFPSTLQGENEHWNLELPQVRAGSWGLEKKPGLEGYGGQHSSKEFTL